MITTIADAPENVAAFVAAGEVNKEDYTSVVIPRVEENLKQEGHINFLLVLDTKLSNFSMSTIMQDLGIGLKHFTKWHKMAIVSESGAINEFTDAFSYVIPGEAKGFTHTELEEATKWVSE